MWRPSVSAMREAYPCLGLGERALFDYTLASYLSGAVFCRDRADFNRVWRNAYFQRYSAQDAMAQHARGMCGIEFDVCVDEEGIPYPVANVDVVYWTLVAVDYTLNEWWRCRCPGRQWTTLGPSYDPCRKI